MTLSVETSLFTAQYNATESAARYSGIARKALWITSSAVDFSVAESASLRARIAFLSIDLGIDSDRPYENYSWKYCEVNPAESKALNV